MGIIAQVIKHTFEKWITLTGETRKGFNQNALLYTTAGDDSIPLKEERLVLVKVDGTGKYVAVGVLTPTQGAKPGEKILFARDDDGKVVGKISMLKDGTIAVENDKDRTETIKGDTDIKGDGKLTMTIKGDLTFEAQGKVTHKGGADMAHEATGKYSIKGATIEIAGDTELILKTIGTALWCPNGTKVCYICGAPHGGEAMGIVGLKGG